MVASIGAVASPSQGASYYERDGYYATDSPEHRAASAWAGKGAEALGLKGPVDPDSFKTVLEGEVPDGSGRRLCRRMGDGEVHHRPGRDLTFSAPKSVALAALVGGDGRIVEAHDRAAKRALLVREDRRRDPDAGPGDRPNDPERGSADADRHLQARDVPEPRSGAAHALGDRQHAARRRRQVADDGQREPVCLEDVAVGALYRSELAGELAKLGYGIKRTHADGRFEIAGVPRHIIEAFSTRRAEIEAAMEGRGLGSTAENQHLAHRAALMTRAAKRDVDRDALRETWARQAAELGFDAPALVAEAAEGSPGGAETERGGTKEAGKGGRPPAARQADLFEHAARVEPAREAVGWALAHLSERDAVFARTDLLAAALAYSPGAASIGEIERAAANLEREGKLHDPPAFEGGGLTTDRAVADERDGCADARRRKPGQGADPRLDGRPAPAQGAARGRTARRGEADPLGEGPHGRRAGLRRHRQDADAEPDAGAGGEKGWRMAGLAPSASAARTLAAE